MNKVISFKIDEKIYDKLKSEGKSFRAILEPLLIDYLSKKDGIPASIPQENSDLDESLDQSQKAINTRSMAVELVDAIKKYFKKEV